MEDFLSVMAGAFVLIVFGTLVWFLFRVMDLIIDGKINNPFEKYKTRNLLYRCNHDDCKRMYRKYQIDLFKAVKGDILLCPHCAKPIVSPKNVWQRETTHTRVYTEDAWMAHHIDCPKIGLKDYLNIRKAIRSAKKIKEETAAIQRFEEYNNLEPNMDWIVKLQKDLSK